MANISSSDNSRAYLAMAAFGLLGLTWFGLQFVKDKLSLLPVVDMPTAARKPVVTNVKSLYPVWRNSSQKRNDNLTANEDIDSLFKGKTVPTVKAVDEIGKGELKFDLDLAAKQSISIEGVADNGAFVNGRFYTFGSSIDVALTKSNGEQVRPVLKRVQGKQLVVQIDGKEQLFLLPTSNY